MAGTQVASPAEMYASAADTRGEQEAEKMEGGGGMRGRSGGGVGREQFDQMYGDDLSAVLVV